MNTNTQFSNLISLSVGLLFGAIIGLVLCFSSMPAHGEGYGAAPPSESEPDWSAASPEVTAPDPREQVAPPRGSFGVLSCRQYAIWVFLANGKSYRYDSQHKQIKSADEMKKLLDWLNTGPTDLVKIECGATV